MGVKKKAIVKFTGPEILFALSLTYSFLFRVSSILNNLYPCSVKSPVSGVFLQRWLFSHWSLLWHFSEIRIKTYNLGRVRRNYSCLPTLFDGIFLVLRNDQLNGERAHALDKIIACLKHYDHSAATEWPWLETNSCGERGKRKEVPWETRATAHGETFASNIRPWDASSVG